MNRQVAIVILSKNNPEVLKTCIETIRKYTVKTTYKLYICDTGSENHNLQNIIKYLKKHYSKDSCQLLSLDHYHFAGNNNDIIREHVEEPWVLLGSYFNGQCLKQLVRHQLESYNNFVTYQIQKTIDMFNPIHICSDHDFNKTVGKYSLELFISFESVEYGRKRNEKRSNS